MSPIASGAHSFLALGLKATAQTASTRKKVPSPSTTAPAKLPPKSGLMVAAP